MDFTYIILIILIILLTIVYLYKEGLLDGLGDKLKWIFHFSEANRKIRKIHKHLEKNETHKAKKEYEKVMQHYKKLPKHLQRKIYYKGIEAHRKIHNIRQY